MGPTLGEPTDTAASPRAPRSPVRRACAREAGAYAHLDWIDLGRSGGGAVARNEHRTGSTLPVTPPTLADVAERAGVSRQTVSNAVNNPDLLRPDTLERVRQTIAELGYSPNRAARNLRTRTSSLIGLRFAPAQ